MSHLSPDELIDAVEHTLATERRVHLAQCAACEREVAHLAAVLHEARAIDAHEPSQVFWDRFSQRVRRAIDSEPAVPPRLVRWFQWPVLVPIGALAMLVVALVSALPERVTDRANARLALNRPAASSAQAEFDADAQWAMVEALVGEMDVVEAQQAGIATTPGSADKVISQLSADEREELLRLLREELKASGG